jgi:hypothetical protein
VVAVFTEVLATVLALEYVILVVAGLEGVPATLGLRAAARAGRAVVSILS